MRVRKHLQENTLSKNVFKAVSHNVCVVKCVGKGIDFSAKHTTSNAATLVQSVVKNIALICLISQ